MAQPKAMVNPNQVSTLAVQMGQSSSQPHTSIIAEQGSNGTLDTAESKYKLRKEKKGKKRKRASLENALRAEESAHAVLVSNGDMVNDGRQSSHDNDVAASSQLQAESSPSRPAASYRLESNASRNSDEVNGDDQVAERRNKRRKRHVRESPMAEYEKSKTTNITSDANIPSVQSLDDINTEDEAIASYLRGYENDQTITAFSPYAEDVESASAMEDLAAKVARDGSPILMESTYQLPSHSAETSSKSKNDGKMRKRASGADIDSEEDNTRFDLPNGIGQHTFDEEAFDEYINSMLNSANGYDQALSYDIPIDPDLTEDGGQILSEAERSLPEMNLDFTEAPASNRELSRVYPLRKLRPRKLKPNTDIFTLSRDDSPLLDHEEQDQITPGPEDARSRISDSGSPLGDSNRHTAPRSSVELVMTTEKTPPPLAKRSKPRGNKTQQGGRKAKNQDPPLSKIAQKGGMFTEREITKIEALRNAYCEEHEINKWKFNEFIHAPVRGNADVVELWDSIHELFPYRTRMSVSRFCRRKFHNFPARGVWTESGDEMLRKAVAEKGNSWKAVGALINRFPEDCRDRYRNYHVNAENRNRTHWTEAETKNLCWAVYDCMLARKAEAKKAKEEKYRGRDMPESEPEDSDQEIRDMKLINWQAVSDRMGESGGSRSRLQCSFKWGKLKKAERDQYMREIRDMLKDHKKSEGRKPKWRHRRAIRKLRNMKSGDRHHLLQALLTCDVEKEENIHWRKLGDEEFRARWTTRDKKAAWEVFKKGVPGSDTADYRDVVQHLLDKLMAEESDRLHERWDPDVDGDINVELRRYRKMKRDGKRKHGIQEESVRENKYKSQPIVESDAEEQDADEHQDQPAEQEDEIPDSAGDEDKKDAADSRSPDEFHEDRDAEQSGAGGQQSSAEDQASDDSLFQSNGDDGDDEELFLSG